MTLYDPQSKSVKQDVFQSVNGVPVGNIFQSMTATPDAFVLVANNSGLIRVTNRKMELQHTIDDLQSPRYGSSAGEGQIAIADWNTNAVYFYSTSSWSATGSVNCNTGPDQMLYDQSTGMLWVVNSGGFAQDSTVTIINASARSVNKTLITAGNPNSLVRDASGNVWVLCGGIKDWSDPDSDLPGALFRFDNQGNELNRWNFTDTALVPAKMAVNGSGTSLYWIDNAYGGNIFKMEISDNTLPGTPFVQGNYHALGVDPVSGDVYCGDAKDFASAGKVDIYSSNGSLKNTFAAGIIPANIYFE
jgi:hypothetical protein